MSRACYHDRYMKTVLKNLSVFAALVFVVYLVANYEESALSRILTLLHLPQTSVKGIATEKAHDISNKFTSDLSSQFVDLEEQALNFTLGDAITELSRLQKIPRDFQSLRDYTSSQITNFTKKK